MDHNRLKEFDEMQRQLQYFIPGKWKLPIRIIEHKWRRLKSEKSKRTIFTGGLPVNFTTNELHLYFERFGKIADIKLHQNRFSHEMNTWAEIEFQNKNGKKKVMSQNLHMIKGKRIDCDNRDVDRRSINHNDIDLGGDTIIHLEGLPKDMSITSLIHLFKKMFDQVRQAYIVEITIDTNEGVVQFYNPNIATFLGEKKIINIDGIDVEMQTLKQLYDKARNGQNFVSLYRCEKTSFNFPLLIHYQLMKDSFPEYNSNAMSDCNLSENSPVFMIGDEFSKNNKPALDKSKISFTSTPFKVSQETLKGDFPALVKSTMSFTSNPFKVSQETPKDDFPVLVCGEKSAGNIPGFVDGEIPQDNYPGYVAREESLRKSSKRTPNQSPTKGSNELEIFSISNNEQNDYSNTSELSITEKKNLNFDNELSMINICKNSRYNSFREIDKIVNKLSDKETGTLTSKNNKEKNSVRNFEDFLKNVTYDANSSIVSREELPVENSEEKMNSTIS